MEMKNISIRRGLLFGYFDHFAAFVPAAVRTGAMGQLGLVTIGTLGAAGNAQ